MGIWIEVQDKHKHVIAGEAITGIRVVYRRNGEYGVIANIREQEYLLDILYSESDAQEFLNCITSRLS